MTHPHPTDTPGAATPSGRGTPPTYPPHLYQDPLPVHRDDDTTQTSTNSFEPYPSHFYREPAPVRPDDDTPGTSTNSFAVYAPDAPYQDPQSVRGEGPSDEEKGEAEPNPVSQPSKAVSFGGIRHFCNTFLERIPYPVAHFLGHRREAPKPLHDALVLLWAFIGIMGSILLISVATRKIPAFHENGAPVIVASFGAAAVLEFHAIHTPLSQPRNAVCSQIIASVIGVCVSKLFGLAKDDDHIRWVGGALSCAIATTIMALTGTIHPPAGATALIAVVDERSTQMGWWLIPLVLLSCVIMMGIALILNNLQRRFPEYWWSPRKTNKEEGK